MSQKQLRIYADGCFDLFHLGHMNQFKQCKEMFPGCHLIIGISSDEDIKKYKGKTILNYLERKESVSHCKYVDEILDNAPWIIDEQFLTDNNIDFVVHDDEPYKCYDVQDIYYIPKKLNKFKASQRTEGIDTSNIISRILKDRQQYYFRNLFYKQLGLTRFHKYYYSLLQLKQSIKDKYYNFIKKEQ